MKLYSINQSIYGETKNYMSLEFGEKEELIKKHENSYSYLSVSELDKFDKVNRFIDMIGYYGNYTVRVDAGIFELLGPIHSAKFLAGQSSSKNKAQAWFNFKRKKEAQGFINELKDFIIKLANINWA